MNAKGIISRIDIKALYIGIAVLLVLSLISFMIGNHLFWKRVTEVRMLTGADSSMEVGLQVIREPRIVMMNLLMISIKYAIAVAVVLKFARHCYFLNAVSFGFVGVILLNMVFALWNIRGIIDYPDLTSLEVAVAIAVCAAVGSVVQLIFKRNIDPT